MPALRKTRRRSAGVHGIWGDVVEVDEAQLDEIAFELRGEGLEGV